MNKKISLGILALLLIAVVLVSGCTGKPTYTNGVEDEEEPETQPTATKVQTIEIFFISAESWDADAEIDGLEVNLRPADANDDLVKTAGTVEIKLWQLECTDYSEYIGMCMEEKCTMKDGDLLETWSLPITKDDYDPWLRIRAEYRNYQVTDDELAMGCAKVTLITPDGKRFEALDDAVFINGF